MSRRDGVPLTAFVRTQNLESSYPIRVPLFQPLHLTEETDQSLMMVTSCVGTRCKCIAGVKLTECFLMDYIGFSGTIDDRLETFGKGQYGRKNFIGLRVWEHDKDRQLYDVDFLFWKYEWVHADGCNGQDHK